jgi:transcriptional regulator with XRE-family HTH domain
MTQDDWSARLTARVAEALKRYRKERGMSAQEVTDACAAVGHAIPRSVIANLESGRRASLDIAELLVLAEVLGIPPVTLLFPPDSAEPVEPLPGRTMHAWHAIEWVAGEVPHFENAPEGTPQAALDALRGYQIVVNSALLANNLADQKRREAAVIPDPDARANAMDGAMHMEWQAERDLEELLVLDVRLRDRGITPPPLPPELKPGRAVRRRAMQAADPEAWERSVVTPPPSTSRHRRGSQANVQPRPSGERHTRGWNQAED